MTSLEAIIKKAKNAVAVRHKLGTTLVTGHKAAYWEEAMKIAVKENFTEVYNEVKEREKHLQAQEQTEEIKARLAEITLVIVRIQQVLLQYINNK